jgi:hypothetical protein
MNTARVYDSDIDDVNENDMRNMAAAVALAYHGNWESMIGWQRHCQQGLPLGKKDVRTILNMVLSDSTQSHWHHEIRGYLRGTPARPPRLHVVREEKKPERKWIINTTAKWKADYFRPDHKMGKIHLIDHGRTFMHWSIPSKYLGGRYIERDVNDPKVPQLVVFGWCGKRYDDVLLAEQDDSDTCAGCRKVRDEIGKPPSETRKNLR